MKRLIILTLFIFSCDEEDVVKHGCLDSTACNYDSTATIDNNSCIYVERNICNSCTEDFDCITGEWDYLTYYMTPPIADFTDECLSAFDDNYIFDLWNLEIKSDSTIMFMEQNGYYYWTSNSDTLFVDYESSTEFEEANFYLTMSFNNNNNIVLTSETVQTTDEEGNLICEYKWNAEFKKK
jgi:hypothetical protein